MSRRRAAADIVPHGFVLAWLHLKARPDGERLRESRAHLDPRDLFTADVLQRLAVIKESLGPAFSGLDARVDGGVLARSLQHNACTNHWPNASALDLQPWNRSLADRTGSNQPRLVAKDEISMRTAGLF